MYSRCIKNGVFVLEAFNALATTYFFYYAYFFMRDQHGFGTLQNLLLAAGSGLIYTVSARIGGKFAQKRGFFPSLRVGFLIMSATLFVGGGAASLFAHLTVLVVATVGMCFTWPALQALISDREPPQRLQSLVGIYNFTWAAGSAVAYFLGGALLEALGPRSMFYLPAGVHLGQWAMAWWLERKALRQPRTQLGDTPEPGVEQPPGFRDAALNANLFLRMAWLANPFAYLAVNTVVPVIPTLASRLELSPTWAGVVCSIWFFTRAGASAWLRGWRGWHFRFGWLAGAYAAMVVSFAAMLLASVLWLLVAAQIVFGLALGLIYYSSLYYSMQAGETKGEHGGVHEAMIGAGCCAGPAIGAEALYFFPAQP